MFPNKISSYSYHYVMFTKQNFSYNYRSYRYVTVTKNFLQWQLPLQNGKNQPVTRYFAVTLHLHIKNTAPLPPNSQRAPVREVDALGVEWEG